jgi:integrase
MSDISAFFMPKFHLVRDAWGRSPYWYCSYRGADGRRLKISTKETDKEKAHQVGYAIANGAQAIGDGSATETQLRKAINRALEQVGKRHLRNPSIEELLTGWIAEKTGAVSPVTLRSYKSAAKCLVAFLGREAKGSVRSLTKNHVIEFRNQLAAEGRTPSTVNKILKSCLSAPFESARKEGLIDFNPFAAVDGLKDKRVERQGFTQEQVAAMLKAARGTDWEGAIVVAYTTAMRQQDVANLRWSSIDVEYGVVNFVQSKTDGRAVIGLHPDLADWISRQPAPDDPEAYLFPSLAGRSGNGRKGLCAEFHQIMEKAGVTGRVLRERAGIGKTVRSLSFHSFRHGATSEVYNRAALKEIARRLTGHTSRGVVDRYIHEDIEAIKAATALIPRLPKWLD